MRKNKFRTNSRGNPTFTKLCKLIQEFAYGELDKISTLDKVCIGYLGRDFNQLKR